MTPRALATHSHSVHKDKRSLSLQLPANPLIEPWYRQSYMATLQALVHA